MRRLSAEVEASRKVRKPTMPRIRPMADAASRTPAPRSSASSASVSGSGATAVAGDAEGGDGRRAANDAPRPRASTTWRPGDERRRAGRAPAATAQPRPESSASLELASTSSSSLAHRRGHDGALGHRVALAQHQHGEGLGEEQQAVEVADHQEAARRPARQCTPTIIQRRPPLARSRAGPISGATTAKGAMVSTGRGTTLPPGLVGVESRRTASRPGRS